MEGKKQLRKPSNWQDFESLSKVLWGEIWNCTEIKKNGRAGQAQHGVDVYGVPSGEAEYFGIQCKGKDNYTKAPLTKKEIDEEIEKAKTFLPKLKKFYFATTASKDAIIEEYIRTKDIESRLNGFFEIHLFSWEDIVDLIDEHPRSYDYYVNSRNFKSQLNIDVFFSDGLVRQQSIIIRNKHVTHYRHEPLPKFKAPPVLEKILNSPTLRAYDKLRNLGLIGKAKINKSYIVFGLQLSNIGSQTAHNYRLEFELIGELSDLVPGKVYEMHYPIPRRSSYRIKELSQFKFQIVPESDVLVPMDSARFQFFSIKPNSDAGEIVLKWKFLSSEGSKEGQLTINFTSDDFYSSKEVIIPKDETPRKETSYSDYFEALNVENE
jgi:hypothetical protein